MNVQNISSSPVKPESSMDILADFVGAITNLQAEIAQFDIKDRERELAMGKAEEAQQQIAYQEQLKKIAAYEKAKEEAESEPAWKRALMGIATLGMSELGPLLEKGISQGLHDLGVHNGPLLKYLSKALTIVAIMAVMVLATAATGGAAGVGMAEEVGAGGAEAEEAAGGAAEAAEDGASQSALTPKVLSFGLAQGIQSTNLGTSIAQDANASSDWMIATLVLQTVGCLVMGGYGMTGEGSAFGGLSKLGANANRMVQLGKGIQALSMLAASGYSGYQVKRQFDEADALGKMGDVQKNLTMLSSIIDQFNQGLGRSNAVVTAALKQSPNAVASHLAEGYQMPQYLIQG